MTSGTADRQAAAGGALRILSGGAANGLVSRVESAFLQETGLEVAGDYGAVGVMHDRVVAGEAVDVIILTRALIGDLAASGHVIGDSVTDIGNVVTGIAVKAGQPIPDISSAQALRHVLAQADALFVPDTVRSTAGQHVARMLAALGLTGAFTDRLREFPNGQTAMAALAREGTAGAIGCTQITEILNTAGVDYAGDLPGEHGLSTIYTAAVAGKAAQAEAARLLVARLASPETADLRRQSGFS